jgi:arylsulfotransferase ASST
LPGAALALVVVAASSGGGPPLAEPAHAAAATKLTIRTSPPLRPAYSAAVPDYAVRCNSAKPVSVDATIPAGQTVAVDGQPPAQGSLKQDVSLATGQAFTFTVNGSATHNVRCAPLDLPVWRVERRGNPVVQWITFAPTEREKPPRGAPYSVIADNHGVPVWWLRDDDFHPVATTVLLDGSVIWGRLGGPFSQTGWDHVKLDGTVLPMLDTVGVHADHHDLQVLPNGNHLMIAYVPRKHVDLRRFGGPRDATVFDGQVQELTPGGRRVWSWSTKGHVKLSETEDWRLKTRSIKTRYQGRPSIDLIHMNSVQYVGPNLLFSGRNLHGVYLVRRSDGRILWKLGGTRRAQSLKVKGDVYSRFPIDGQHDARMYPDGTLSVHDNGSARYRRPRVVRYRINRRTKTARLVQRLVDKRVKHSYCCGSAQRLAKGRWLVDWGANSLIEELTGRGKRVLALTLPRKLFSYRAQSVPRGVLTRDALRAAMNTMFPR